jgi:RimJ/RimL family protein N-acetyltransferase
MPFPLETDRLVLRYFRVTDLDVFHAYRSDPQVARFQGWDIPYAIKNAQSFIDEMENALPGTPGKWFQAAIELKDTKTLVGDCAFHVMANDTRQAYLGFTLGVSHWCRGYSGEACRRLLDYLFDELNLHRVVAECDVKNVASYKLLERLGFRREAQLIENIWFKGAWGSEYHNAILEREWKRT